ncbi:MAG: PAS domain-containing protein [Deltaproteobacteria bacterium]|nr:PAS domain-containing protein [Deltaproteobacteria bacterium]
MSNIEAIIYFRDLNGKHTMVNQKFLAIFDIELSDITNKTHSGSYTNDISTKHMKNNLKVITSKKVITFEETAMLTDGLHYYISIKFPIFDNKNNIIGTGGISTDITERKRLGKELLKSNKELKNSLKEIKTLRGILPICTECKNIRDSKGYWSQVEDYIESHSEAIFSHGLCEKCSAELYGDQEWFMKRQQKV